jgi:hypothetical protein
MALTPTTMVHQAGRSGGPNVITYTNGVDNIAAMIVAGYFNGVADRLNVNDVIVAIDTAAPTIDVLVVTALTPNVTVVNGT